MLHIIIHIHSIMQGFCWQCMHIDMPSYGLMLHPPFLAPNFMLQGTAVEVMVVVQLSRTMIMKGRWCSVMCLWRLCR